MTTDYRALCAELAEALCGYEVTSDDFHVIRRARAALAEPEPEVVGPTDEELLELWHGSDWFDEGATLGEFRSIARAVLARYSHQPAPPAKGDCPAYEGVPKPGNQPCAVCGRSAPVPAEGEVAELVAWLHGQDGGIERRAIYSRIADLLEQRQPAPVPVSERLPGPEDCDEEGRCWWGFEETDDYEASWTLRKMIGLPFDDTHWLPATALPLPQGDVE